MLIIFLATLCSSNVTFEALVHNSRELIYLFFISSCLSYVSVLDAVVS